MIPLRTITAAFPGVRQPRRGHFIAALHKQLAGEGFDSEILAPRVFREDAAEDRIDALPVHRFSYRSHDRLPKAGRMSAATVISYLRSGRRAARELWPVADGARGGLVFAHWVVPSGWIGLGIARRLGVPLVLYGHGSDLNRYGTRFPERLLVGRVLRGAHETIVASSLLAEIAAGLTGRSAASFPVLPMGISSTFAPPEGAPPPLPPLRVLFVGDAIPSKGLEPLLSSVRQVRARGRDVVLEVVGTGPLLDRGRGVEGIVIRGELGEIEVRKAMERSHVLVLASRGEGTPLVVQEALAMRLPVAATPVGGIPELFRERRGWLRLEGGDAVEIARLLEKLLATGESGVRERRRAMETNSIEDLYLGARAACLAEVLRSAAAPAKGAAP